MGLTTIILLVLFLWLVQIFLQETSRFRFDLWAILSNRDHQPEPSVIAARLQRAKDNLLESLPVFLALALLAEAKGIDASRAALVFLIARVLYVPAYASGIPVLRSLIWLVSIAALAAMAIALV